MPRTKIKDIRKNEIIEAAIAEIGRTGSTDITVAKIADVAGVSSGLAHHYFGSKEQILISAMRRILTIFGADVRKGLARSQSPEQRLEAIVISCFSSQNFRPGITNAWLSFYVQAQYSKDTERLLHIYYHRLQSNLKSNLKPLIGTRAEEVAVALASLIDGLYIRLSFKGGNLSPDDATDIALGFLRQSLSATSA